MLTFRSKPERPSGTLPGANGGAAGGAGAQRPIRIWGSFEKGAEATPRIDHVPMKKENL